MEKARVRVSRLNCLKLLAQRSGKHGLACYQIVFLLRIALEIVEFRARGVYVLVLGCEEASELVPAEGVSRIVGFRVSGSCETPGPALPC